MKKKIFSPVTAWMKRSNRLVIALWTLFVLTSGCSTSSTQKIAVGNTNNTTGHPHVTISLNDIITNIIPHIRLINKDFTYQYIRSDLISFPLQPNQYAYYLVITAEATPANASSSKTYQKLYCELLNSDGQLFFNPGNFQQSCSSTTCANCELIMYQNGSFGCECDGNPADETSPCTYEKSRLLTNKQQKSDII